VSAVNFSTSNVISIIFLLLIQSVPLGKVNILEGHSIGHSKQKKCICTCVLFRSVSEIEIFHCTIPKLLIKRDITYSF
jgi:hypothetical protein